MDWERRGLNEFLVNYIRKTMSGDEIIQTAIDVVLGIHTDLVGQVHL